MEGALVVCVRVLGQPEGGPGRCRLSTADVRR